MRFLDNICGFYNTLGECVIYTDMPTLGRNANKPVALYSLPPHLVEPIYSRDFRKPIKHYVFYFDGKSIMIEPHRILHIKKWKPLNNYNGDGLHAISPIDVASNILNREKANQKAQARAYINGGRAFLISAEKPSLPELKITPLSYEDYMMVEYVDLSASAGMLGGSNVDLLPETKKRLVRREFEKGNYLVVRVNGDSITDGTDISIPDVMEILVNEYILVNGDKLPITGNLFVVVSRDGYVFKQIIEHNIDIGYIRCHSHNQKYEDFNIPMDDVFQIFIYRKIVGYRPNIPELR